MSGLPLQASFNQTPGIIPSYSVGMAETYSWVPIDGASRPLYARATYVTNFDDFTVSISAAELHVSALEIKDGNSGRLADVVDAGDGTNGLRVVTQDLEPQYDTVSLADTDGNTVGVTSSALNVNVINVINAADANTKDWNFINATVPTNTLQALSSIICNSVTIYNTSQDKIEVYRTGNSGAFIPLDKNDSIDIRVVANANEVSLSTKSSATTTVVMYQRY